MRVNRVIFLPKTREKKEVHFRDATLLICCWHCTRDHGCGGSGQRHGSDSGPCHQARQPHRSDAGHCHHLHAADVVHRLPSVQDHLWISSEGVGEFQSDAAAAATAVVVVVAYDAVMIMAVCDA